MNKIKYLLAAAMACSIPAKADEVLSYEERIVALTILGEARGEGEKGMYAVACVIRKRAVQMANKLGAYPHANVCLQRKQFSTWNGIEKESELYHLWKSKSTPYARKIARIVCGNSSMCDTTKGADHFHSTKMKKPPYWTKGHKPTVIIGNHAFYNLRRK
jgi:spore germination cell wall hydrolase CwlJ-like protein